MHIEEPKVYYQNGEIAIYHGDCLGAKHWGPEFGRKLFDLVLTDPPYGIKADKRSKILSRANIAAARDYGESNFDDPGPNNERMVGIRERVEIMRQRGKNAIIWGGNYFTLPPGPGWLVWDKDNTGDFADCELAWTDLPMAVRKFRYRWNGMLQEHTGQRRETRVHPTQKPLALMRWCEAAAKRLSQKMLF